MTLRVIETFSGIGSQAKALERIKDKNPNFDYEIVATCEWEVGAIYAYDLIHNGKQDLKKYDHLTKIELIEILSRYTLSSNGKTPLTRRGLQHMSLTKLKAILHSIEENNNFVDINSVHANDLPDADLLTYSFPCQDLSISSFWWNNTSGIDPNSGNSSSLLWQIGRILTEYNEIGKELPRFLLMENVTQIESPMHADNFNQWKRLLKGLGYSVNITFQLNARNFGIPQNRVRTYMISVIGEEYTSEIREQLENSSLTERIDNPKIDRFLRLDYSNPVYYNEALQSIPNYTDSRIAIHEKAAILAKGNIPETRIAKTITTKQDRNPTAGVIEHHLKLDNPKLAPYRNLTPRETFLLMGFDEKDFQIIIDNNYLESHRPIVSHAKLLKMSGNSIVVDVLVSVFQEIIRLNDIYFEENNIYPINLTLFNL